jgi:tryptophan synthase alpha chain
MNRLEQQFAQLRRHNQKAQTLFITAGDPDLESTLQIMQALADYGAHILELGIPFSDPIADGPAIQRSSQRALQNHVHIPQILGLVSKFRKTHSTPVILMGYYNPLLRYGLEQFVVDCHLKGVDGLIIADLPFEEADLLAEACRQEEVSLIFLVAPEKGGERAKKIAAASSGFIYCVSHYGTTGQSDLSGTDLDVVIGSLRSMTDLPIQVGFGISSLKAVQEACRFADGVIIGSWLIRTLEESVDKAAAAGEFAKIVSQALLPAA